MTKGKVIKRVKVDMRQRHPWLQIPRWIKDRHRTMSGFCKLLRVSPSDVKLITKWEKDIDSARANVFSMAFWTSSQVWLNMQKAYNKKGKK